MMSKFKQLSKMKWTKNQKRYYKAINYFLFHLWKYLLWCFQLLLLANISLHCLHCTFFCLVRFPFSCFSLMCCFNIFFYANFFCNLYKEKVPSSDGRFCCIPQINYFVASFLLIFACSSEKEGRGYVFKFVKI